MKIKFSDQLWLRYLEYLALYILVWPVYVHVVHGFLIKLTGTESLIYSLLGRIFLLTLGLFFLAVVIFSIGFPITVLGLLIKHKIKLSLSFIISIIVWLMIFYVAFLMPIMWSKYGVCWPGHKTAVYGDGEHIEECSFGKRELYFRRK